jgi:hypothetical protein
MTIKVPENAKTAFDGNMQTSSAVELPFSAPAFFIVNGNAQLQQVGGIHYFGGWACGTEKLKEAADSWENVTFPVRGLTPTETIVQSGQKLPVYASRSLLVAPIGIRKFSTIKDPSGQKRRVPPFTKGARPGIQVVCMLGYKDENKNIFPWAPIILTANGYQTNNVQGAFSNWNKAIKPLVQKLIPDQKPASVSNLFWMAIGTFGQDRIQKPAGEKFITPVSCYIPENLDEKILESLYVGEEIAEYMADLSEKSREWFQVFNVPANSQKLVAEPVEEHDNWDMQEPPPPEDDIPF